MMEEGGVRRLALAREAETKIVTEIERLVERAAKDLADLRKVIERLQAILAEYAETIDTLAREREERP